MSDTTIRKRLSDFKKTPSGQLTIDEFYNIDLEEEQDPPCFTEARQKQKQLQLDGIEGNYLPEWTLLHVPAIRICEDKSKSPSDKANEILSSKVTTI